MEPPDNDRPSPGADDHGDAPGDAAFGSQPGGFGDAMRVRLRRAEHRVDTEDARPRRRRGARLAAGDHGRASLAGQPRDPRCHGHAGRAARPPCSAFPVALTHARTRVVDRPVSRPIPDESSAARARCGEASMVFIALVSATNAWSASRLEHQTAAHLLTSGSAIWLTNVIVFCLWHWELDRGGPSLGPTPCTFTRSFSSPDDEPRAGTCALGVDLRRLPLLSFTNATAFSPTTSYAVRAGQAHHDAAAAIPRDRGPGDRPRCQRPQPWASNVDRRDAARARFPWQPAPETPYRTDTVPQGSFGSDHVPVRI